VKKENIIRLHSLQDAKLAAKKTAPTPTETHSNSLHDGPAARALKLNICGRNGAQQLLCRLQRCENHQRIQAANWFGNSMFIEANTATTLNTETCTRTLRNESTGSNASLMSQLQYLAYLTNIEWRLAGGGEGGTHRERAAVD
jgi:hypothetical protein